MNPKYPIYIISKGRWKSRLTSKALERMGVPYHIAVEPQESDEYAQVIDKSKILVLPFSNLGQGSIPARNWVWEHSVSDGHPWHWVLDDNISNFGRMNRNLQVIVECGATFRAAEDFALRYDNIALAGFQYDHFCRAKRSFPPYYLNTRIYSTILIRNDIPQRWRGRYNEDTDLSLRCLRDGWATVLFYAFTQFKAQTMTMKGGNSDELYHGNGRLEMAQSLQRQHPDVVTVGERFGRPQHVVDYSPFAGNKLRRKPSVAIPEGVNNYGMVLTQWPPSSNADLSHADTTLKQKENSNGK